KNNKRKDTCSQIAKTRVKSTWQSQQCSKNPGRSAFGTPASLILSPSTGGKSDERRSFQGENGINLKGSSRRIGGNSRTMIWSRSRGTTRSLRGSLNRDMQIERMR